MPKVVYNRLPATDKIGISLSLQQYRFQCAYYTMNAILIIVNLARNTVNFDKC